MRANPRIFTGMPQKKALWFYKTVSNKDEANLEVWPFSEAKGLKMMESRARPR